nr:reverse transcriptase domain-containing protein [Tanacetum cinerariifolium]
MGVYESGLSEVRMQGKSTRDDVEIITNSSNFNNPTCASNSELVEPLPEPEPEGTILEEKLFAEFDELMAMTTNENSKSESDTKEPPFVKITFNTDDKIKTSLEEPSTDLELKPLPDNLESVFLEELSFLPIISP